MYEKSRFMGSKLLFGDYKLSLNTVIAYAVLLLYFAQCLAFLSALPSPCFCSALMLDDDSTQARANTHKEQESMTCLSQFLGLLCFVFLFGFSSCDSFSEIFLFLNLSSPSF
jgi:hypothetical protein